ncbi:hypothetical protein HHL16_23235 [Pseudoflavitalea sp. G-6-1-2]|uniref:heme-binding protein n=1 Tax=Pseudoflavitalea sp. G-6-1-2 TaxID=2728841 RepID=UPI001469B264|nr:heme-binding protein [Pseudoflavitalea sp. G-6-1-2]NML23815.1 hypothetical protein [Pseudoflavitalea sp. G-6-1-2]
MSNNGKNPLDLLNIAGQRQLESIIDLEENKAPGITGAQETVPTTATLGFLQNLPGTWVGTGFNLIELPNMNQIQPGPPPPEKFKVMMNATSETLVISKIAGEIINRGNAQGDIGFMGLHYLQQINDVNLPQGQNGIHLETGLWLNVPASTSPNVQATVARLGSIPHGDSLLATGLALFGLGGPSIPDIDSTPFTVDPNYNSRVNDPHPTYLSILQNAVPPPGIPKEAIMNPNIILKNAIEGQTIIDTTTIFLDANFILGVGNVFEPASQTGNIVNIPFVDTNANAMSFTAIFWIETVQGPNNTTFLQLQYSQQVILDFPVFGSDGKTVTDLKWPHISVATLRLQP